MKRPRHLIMSAALAVAFLSAGAFAQVDDMQVSQNLNNQANSHITVISKSSHHRFRLLVGAKCSGRGPALNAPSGSVRPAVLHIRNKPCAISLPLS